MAQLSNADIATELTVSVHTVRNHVANLSAKLGAHSTLKALAIAVREGLLPRTSTIRAPPYGGPRQGAAAHVLLRDTDVRDTPSHHAAAPRLQQPARDG